MADRYAGFYIAPFGGDKPPQASYERAQPHRHDFYYCVLLEKGRLEMVVDFQPVHLPEPSLYLSYPGQIHQVNAASVEQGWYFACEPSFLEARLRDILDQFLAGPILVSLSSAQAASLSGLLRHLHAVQQDHAMLFRQEVVRQLATAFVYQLAAAYAAVEQSALSKHSARSVELTKSFKQLLRQHYKTVHKPAEFAARLHITTTHLNDTVRLVTGFPVTYYIQQHVMQEAQRLLHHSSLAINEVAYELGFDDAKYFTRLFSKVTGVAPTAFRKASQPPS